MTEPFFLSLSLFLAPNKLVWPKPFLAKKVPVIFPREPAAARGAGPALSFVKKMSFPAQNSSSHLLQYKPNTSPLEK